MLTISAFAVSPKAATEICRSHRAVRSADLDSEKRPIAVLVDREGLGDALLKLPFLRAVRRTFPGRPLWWIATHQTSMAHEMAPWVAGLIDRTVENAGLTEPAREVIPRLRALPPFELVFELADAPCHCPFGANAAVASWLLRLPAGLHVVDAPATRALHATSQYRRAHALTCQRRNW